MLKYSDKRRNNNWINNTEKHPGVIVFPEDKITESYIITALSDIPTSCPS